MPTPSQDARDAMLSDPITGRAAWSGADLADARDWVQALDAADVAEIDAAFRAVKARGLNFADVKAEDFPLPGLAPKLAALLDEIEDGRGVALLRGLPVADYDDEDLRVLWAGIGAHVGPLLPQSVDGKLMRDVRDEAGGKLQKHAPSVVPGSLTSTQKAQSNGPLRFHTDRADVLGLLCVRQAGAGGESKVASSVAVRNAILRRRPDLHELLCQPYWRTRETQDVGGGQKVFAMPVFSFRDGHFSSQYSRTFVEEAQRLDGVPKMTAAMDEALDLLAEVAEEQCHVFRLEPGDMVFYNNHVVYHGRTPFTDDPASRADRLLYRLWFAPARTRPLPECYRETWGSTEPGAYRGGMMTGKRSQAA
ncbi:MAG: TauD/TfdA family dioxygenase [Thalassobaculum sp.]|uniref:TauD/TfdA family dioxygenase n=1 Tax=Thalassobaculum sp. TaxID=2022740 RepID=UPI0032ECDFF4